jgi:hypothetical protein
MSLSCISFSLGDILMIFGIISIPAVFFLGFTMIRRHRIRRAKRVAGPGLAVLASLTILTGGVYMFYSLTFAFLAIHGLVLLGVGVAALQQFGTSKAYAVG